MRLSYEERKALTLYLRDNDTGIGEAIRQLGLQADIFELWEAALTAGFVRCLRCGRWRASDQMETQNDICQECSMIETR